MRFLITYKYYNTNMHIQFIEFICYLGLDVDLALRPSSLINVMLMQTRH